jgi:hypothetical protein
MNAATERIQQARIVELLLSRVLSNISREGFQVRRTTAPFWSSRSVGVVTNLYCLQFGYLSVFFGPHQAEMHPRPLSEQAIPHPFENRDGRVTSPR